jgi:ABC-type transport system involved in Fe-S cluster assembly fused permease/ATPase subunit
MVNKTLSYIIRASVLGIITMVVLLFIPAGMFHYWQGWAFIATFTISSLAYTMYLIRHDPALLKRRTQAGISYEKEPAQKVIIFLLTFPLCCFDQISCWFPKRTA